MQNINQIRKHCRSNAVVLTVAGTQKRHSKSGTRGTAQPGSGAPWTARPEEGAASAAITGRRGAWPGDGASGETSTGRGSSLPSWQALAIVAVGLVVVVVVVVLLLLLLSG